MWTTGRNGRSRRGTTRCTSPPGSTCSPSDSLSQECSPCGVRATANGSTVRCASVSARSAFAGFPSSAANPMSCGLRGGDSGLLRGGLELFLDVTHFVQRLRVHNVGDRTPGVLGAVFAGDLPPARRPHAELLAEQRQEDACLLVAVTR